MWSAFAERKPWAAVVLVFLLGPAVVMFYLGKARVGLVYLVVMFFFPPLALLGIPHSYLIAKQQQGMRPTDWHGKRDGLILIAIVSVLVTGVGTRALFWEPFSSPSGNLQPTLMVGDRYFVSKYAYGYSRYSFPFALFSFEGRIWSSPVERGDMVVFRKPPENEINYIERIIGLPGDRIQMLSGILHINGEAVERERIEDFEAEYGRKVAQYMETLPNGRRHGILEAQGDGGQSDNTVEFIVPEGHYFAMGDNRDNSADSRAFGFIPVDNLIGKLSVVYWRGRDSMVTWATPD